MRLPIFGQLKAFVTRRPSWLLDGYAGEDEMETMYLNLLGVAMLIDEYMESVVVDDDDDDNNQQARNLRDEAVHVCLEAAIYVRQVRHLEPQADA